MVVSLSLNQARCYISIQIDVGHDLYQAINERHSFKKPMLVVNLYAITPTIVESFKSVFLLVMAKTKI